MRAEKFWLYFSLYLLLIVGFSLINLVVFFEIKRAEEENLYRLAHVHFMNYLCNPMHRGSEEVVIKPPEVGYRIYSFEDPTNPPNIIKVGIKEDYFQERLNSLMKKILFLEFLLILTLVSLYQAVVEGYIKKLEKKEGWVRQLILSLTHRLGNFMATQKVLLALLKKTYGEDENLKRMEKSLTKAQRDFSIFTNLAREDKTITIEYLNLREHVEEVLNYFDDELAKKRLKVSLKDMFVRMDRTDLDDVLYNLVGNALKHSKSFVHIKICLKARTLIIRNDTSQQDRPGMGIGLELVQRIIDKYRFKLNLRYRKNYTVFVSFT